jgi:hypothetical protein
MAPRRLDCGGRIPRRGARRRERHRRGTQRDHPPRGYRGSRSGRRCADRRRGSSRCRSPRRCGCPRPWASRRFSRLCRRSNRWTVTKAAKEIRPGSPLGAFGSSTPPRTPLREWRGRGSTCDESRRPFYGSPPCNADCYYGKDNVRSVSRRCGGPVAGSLRRWRGRSISGSGQRPWPPPARAPACRSR